MNKLVSDLWLQLQSYYEGIVTLLPKLILAILVFTVLYFIANRSKKLVNSRLTARMDDPLLARFLARMVKVGIVIFAFMVVFKIVGLEDIAAGLITGASVSAIVIGFAFKDIGENFLAGIMLAFNRPFRIGDTVELSGIKGSIVALNMRTTHMKSFDGKDIYIPNASVVKDPVINYTIDGFLRQGFTIGLDYGSDVDKAIKIIEEEMMHIDGVLTQKGKQPSAYTSNLSKSTLDLTIHYWLDTFDKDYSGSKIKTLAINKILGALDSAGFYMPGDTLEIKNYNGEQIATGGSDDKDIA